ncbi:MAG: HAMP domain-containing protein [Deltaproteobacteria bacterium]|nr:HAMP domain-containing protein [Deltaproteobacteria bacterium]
MKDYLESEKQDLKRQRRERYIIGILIVAIILLSYIGMNIFELGLDLPISNTILIFALININVILLLLLLFLILRNLVKLLFERKKKIMGAKLRTKLVLAFISLSLLPAVILFLSSVWFISNSIEYWYNLPIERSLENSLEVGQAYYKQITDEILSYGNDLSLLITYHGYMLIKEKEILEEFINKKRVEYRLASIKVFSKMMVLRAVAIDDRIDMTPYKDPPIGILKETFDKGTDGQFIQSSRYGDLISGLVPIFSRTESKAVVGVVVVERFIPGVFLTRLDTVSKGLAEYNEFKKLKRPMKITPLIWLSIVTLIIIFVSVWFGFYLSKGITVPIQELAEGTNRIASGDYDFFINLESKDEIGDLVNSFNRMTLDLKNSKKQLEEANAELIKSNIEIEQRRLYMEIILSNVAAGVVSADARGKILTINKSAERMLNIQSEKVINRYYQDVMRKEYLEIINDFLGDRGLLRKGAINKHIRLAVDNQSLSLLVSINLLRDDRGRNTGLVVVFDDLSEIEKAQRMAAWREVARRIAHEVKNPLTPIQLSAQRLKKRYGHQLSQQDGKIFEECTDMIINQAEGLKRLVNEFSSYARMPASTPMPADIRELIKETAGLFKDTRKNVKIIFHDSPDVPIIKVDREQIKRAMINLLDNAVAAIVDDNLNGGEVIISLSHDHELKVIRIEVSDNGKGIPDDHKTRLFEPYFSTKKHGTGLGLAIVNSIISDHKGVIQVQDNQPRGTIFTIDLPINL